MSVDPADVPADLSPFYDHAFFADGAYADYVADRAIMQRNFARFIRKISRFSSGGRLFEIGAAHGFFLELARQVWTVAGVDISAEATAYARHQLGLDVVCGSFLDQPLEPASVDAIVLWDTIEHLRNPAAYVEKIASTLRPGGIVALTTGDAGALVPRWRGSNWRMYYPPHHLHFFSRRSMTQLLARFGLETVMVESVGFSRSVDTMLYRMWVDRKGAATAHLYRAAKAIGITGIPLYLNLFDIMFVIARKSPA